MHLWSVTNTKIMIIKNIKSLNIILSYFDASFHSVNCRINFSSISYLGFHLYAGSDFELGKSTTDVPAKISTYKRYFVVLNYRAHGFRNTWKATSLSCRHIKLPWRFLYFCLRWSVMSVRCSEPQRHSRRGNETAVWMRTRFHG